MLFSLLRKSPTEFVGELRLAAAVKWYELEMISQSKAAELIAIAKSFFRYGGILQIPPNPRPVR